MRPAGIRAAARDNIIDKNTSESYLSQHLTVHMPREWPADHRGTAPSRECE